jgi:hypothetical protein
VLPSVGYTLHERGAYQLPIAFAAVVLTAQQLGRRLRLATLLLALAGSVTVWCNPVKDSADLGFGQVALDYLRTHPVRLFVSCFAELDGVFDVAQADPDYGPHWRSVMSVPQIVFESERAGGRSAIELALFFHPSVAGATVITAKALDQLRQHGGVYAELVDVTLPSIYALREVNETGTNGHTLHAFRLDPK